MQKEKREFWDAWSETKKTCYETAALLSILKGYCETTDDETIYSIEVFSDALADKIEQLKIQLNQVEICSRYFILK